ncbi:MAG: DUF2505 family protein [Proteobacteria bacterium]|nr:MAG: DUF2505 family protein [Pseudomonadota bacterium]
MAQVTLRNPLDCSPEAYFEGCLFDEAYSTRLFKDVLKFPGVEVLELKKEGDLWRRRVKVMPPMTGIPGPVKKMVGDSMSYIEDGTYDVKAKRYKYTVIPSTAAEKTKTQGEAWCEVENGKTVLVTKFSIDVKVMMIGGMIEDKILADLRASLDQATPFIASFTAEKGLR